MKKTYISPAVNVVKINANMMCGSVRNEDTGYGFDESISSGSTGSGLSKWNTIDFVEDEE